MDHRRRGLPPLLIAVVAVTGACAPAAEDLPQAGSQLEPTFRPEKDTARKKQPKGARESERPAGAGSRTPSAQPGGRPSSASAPAATTSPPPGATASPGAPGGPAAASARVSDPSGDTSGLGGAPSYVDLSGATLTRTDGRYRLVVETAGQLPRRQEDERTMNVVGFVDNDRDGRVDHEVWATLTDNGWGSSSRHPDGARFGDDSGVAVTVSGSTLTLAFEAPVIGGTGAFQWSVASEHGTLEQVASGTTAQDHGPDRGAVPFPG